MRSTTSIIIALLIVLFALSCNKTKVKNEEPDMYQPSELSLLMRTMEAENQQLRKYIVDNVDTVYFPRAYLALNTSKPTVEGTINETYKTLSTAYSMAMDELQNGDSTLVYRFNKGVQACVNCHNQFCGGPITRIEKLRID